MGGKSSKEPTRAAVKRTTLKDWVSVINTHWFRVNCDSIEEFKKYGRVIGVEISEIVHAYYPTDKFVYLGIPSSECKPHMTCISQNGTDLFIVCLGSETKNPRMIHLNVCFMKLVSEWTLESGDIKNMDHHHCGGGGSISGLLATINNSKQICVWDCDSHKKIHEFEGGSSSPDTGPMCTVRFTEDGQSLLCGQSMYIEVYSLKKKSIRSVLPMSQNIYVGHRGNIWALAIHGHTLVSGSVDTKIIDMKKRSKRITSIQTNGNVIGLHFNCDHTCLLAITQEYLLFYEWPTMKSMKTYRFENVNHVAWHPSHADRIAAAIKFEYSDVTMIIDMVVGSSSLKKASLESNPVGVCWSLDEKSVVTVFENLKVSSHSPV